MASFYWARFHGGNDREAWKQRYCQACFQRDIEPWYERLLERSRDNAPLTCIACDQKDTSQLVSMYMTAYVPNAEMERESVDICLEHAPTYQPLLQRGAEMLVDRQADAVEPARARW